MATINIKVPDDAWQETGSEADTRSRLLTTIVVNGCFMHLEAYAVADEGDLQSFADLPYFELEEEAFFSLTTGATDTVEITGREYLLVATPHGA
jgi:hypothetical protein